jgi:hypothetical protein
MSTCHEHCVPNCCYQLLYSCLPRYFRVRIQIAECFTNSSTWFQYEVMFENEHISFSRKHSLHAHSFCAAGISTSPYHSNWHCAVEEVTTQAAVKSAWFDLNGRSAGIVKPFTRSAGDVYRLMCVVVSLGELLASDVEKLVTCSSNRFGGCTKHCFCR